MTTLRPLNPSPPDVPAWYPPWAQRLAELYYSGTTCMFVVHGNVHDLLHCAAPGLEKPFLTLTDFLATQVFGAWDIVLAYDLGGGLRPLPGDSPKRLQEMVDYLTQRLGPRANWPREPAKALAAIEDLVQRNLLDDKKEQKRIAIVLPYAQFLVPAGEMTTLAGEAGARLVRLMSWAQNPYIKRINMAFCLVADKLTEMNDRLVQSAHVATLEVPLPDETARQDFIRQTLGAQAEQRLEGLTVDAVTKLAGGLDLVSLEILLSVGEKLDAKRFRQLKKTLIERQCQGLVEFVQPRHTLDLVVGHEAAKERLRQDAQLITQGHLNAAPMGYLLSGPVGTGKTFIAQCYAGTIGIPCVVLRNFRSKYVGETEGNLEHVLNVLRSLGPVVVIVDEADAALGNRQASGDSGTSGRVFSMIASQMGDTEYRGKLIWMLLTSRPDLLPIDLKRQGRAEVHIPLFYPQETAEIATMFRSMAQKNDVNLEPDAVPEVSPERNLSGADIESIVLTARRRALLEHRTTVTRADVEAALNDFIPSAQGLEKRLQEIQAALECTDRRFLPPVWREQVDAAGGRTRLQERAQSLRQALDAAQ